MIKYKPVYKVSLNGETIGYVQNKQKLENEIDENIINSVQTEAQFITLTEMPSYEFKLASIEETQDEEVLTKIAEVCKPIYKIYGITLDGENKSYVNTLEEAEQLVTSMKQEYDESLQLDIGIAEIYTQETQQVEGIQFAQAETVIEDDLRVKKEEKEAREAATLNDVYFEVKPVVGNITSRFGSRESIRTSSHKGMDIAAPNGTTIKAAAVGTVKYAQFNSGGYGNLVIISHGNGVETYYGHCSRLFVKVGQTVEAGERIAAVGSTGRSTGNHLHFEIRLYGSQVNPQKYIYK